MVNMMAGDWQESDRGATPRYLYGIIYITQSSDNRDLEREKQIERNRRFPFQLQVLCWCKGETVVEYLKLIWTTSVTVYAGLGLFLALVKLNSAELQPPICSAIIRWSPGLRPALPQFLFSWYFVCYETERDREGLRSGSEQPAIFWNYPPEGQLKTSHRCLEWGQKYFDHI